MTETKMDKTEQAEQQPKTRNAALITVGRPSDGALIPQNFEGLWRMAQIMAASGMMPKGMEKPESVFVAVQMGLEVGLSPMQAVQNIAVINGRPSIWGDAALGLVMASGQLEEFNEEFQGEPYTDNWTAICISKRKGRPDPIRREFSYKEARQAGLLEKPIWNQYPRRMLQMRARSWNLRDGYADVLKGLQLREEAIDIVEPMSPSDMSSAAAPIPSPPHQPTDAGTRQVYTHETDPDPDPIEEVNRQVMASQEFDRQVAQTGLTQQIINDFLFMVMEQKGHRSLAELKAAIIENNLLEATLADLKKYAEEHPPTEPAAEEQSAEFSTEPPATSSEPEDAPGTENTSPGNNLAQEQGDLWSQSNHKSPGPPVSPSEYKDLRRAGMEKLLEHQGFLRRLLKSDDEVTTDFAAKYKRVFDRNIDWQEVKRRANPSRPAPPA